MKPYDANLERNNSESYFEVLQVILRERRADVKDFNNLKNVFISGRKVGKIPTASNDVTDGDRVGDFNYSASYLYLCVNDAGSAKWRRVALSTW